MKQQPDRPHSSFVEFLDCVSYRAGQEKLEVLRRGLGGDYLWALGTELPRLREFEVSDGIEALRKVWDRLPELTDEGKSAIQTALAADLKGKFPEDNSAVIASAVWSCILLHGAQVVLVQKSDRLPQPQSENQGYGVSRGMNFPAKTRPKGKEQNQGSGEADPRKRIDVFIQQVLDATGRPITRTNIWRDVGGYQEATEFERYQRRDARLNKSAKSAFDRILSMNPSEFIRELDKRSSLNFSRHSRQNPAISRS